MISNLNSTADKSITIVTAFFDIGRGNWSTDKGHPSHLQRDTETYLSYFENLAKLENEMVVFTFPEMIPHIEKIRRGKLTKIVGIDLDEKFKDTLNRIKKVLRDESFIAKIPEKHRKNPEYWSEKYVLLTNLKTYFVNHAIEHLDLSNSLVAWVDFGYCRDQSTLLNIRNWYYPFDSQHIHFFTLRKDKLFSVFKNPKFPHKKHQVINAILNNEPCIIGGVTVADKKIWIEFLTILKQCQLDLLEQNIVDDDQGIYLMCHLKRPDLFRFHYLGKNNEGKPNWFGVVQKFHI